jgi:hypothetical protein
MLQPFATDIHHHPYLRQWSFQAGIADIGGPKARLAEWLTLFCLKEIRIYGLESFRKL